MSSARRPSFDGPTLTLDAALSSEISAVLRADLMMAKAKSPDELKNAAIASLASLLPGATVTIAVCADPDRPGRFRVSAEF